MSAKESRAHTTQSITRDAELDAYTVGAESTAVGASTAAAYRCRGAAAYFAVQESALVRALSRMMPCADMETLELNTSSTRWYSTRRHSQGHIRGVAPMRPTMCSSPVKGRSARPTRAAYMLASDKQSGKDIRTVAEWEDRCPSHYHAIHARDNVRLLLEGIEERLPGAMPSVARIEPSRRWRSRRWISCTAPSTAQSLVR
jgi:hypothetical protein